MIVIDESKNHEITLRTEKGRYKLDGYAIVESPEVQKIIDNFYRIGDSQGFGLEFIADRDHFNIRKTKMLLDCVYDSINIRETKPNIYFISDGNKKGVVYKKDNEPKVLLECNYFSIDGITDSVYLVNGPEGFGIVDLRENVFILEQPVNTKITYLGGTYFFIENGEKKCVKSIFLNEEESITVSQEVINGKRYDDLYMENGTLYLARKNKKWVLSIHNDTQLYDLRKV